MNTKWISVCVVLTLLVGSKMQAYGAEVTDSAARERAKSELLAFLEASKKMPLSDPEVTQAPACRESSARERGLQKELSRVLALHKNAREDEREFLELARKQLGIRSAVTKIYSSAVLLPLAAAALTKSARMNKWLTENKSQNIHDGIDDYYRGPSAFEKMETRAMGFYFGGAQLLVAAGGIAIADFLSDEQPSISLDLSKEMAALDYLAEDSRRELSEKLQKIEGIEKNSFRRIVLKPFNDSSVINAMASDKMNQQAILLLKRIALKNAIAQARRVCKDASTDRAVSALPNKRVISNPEVATTPTQRIHVPVAVAGAR